MQRKLSMFIWLVELVGGDGGLKENEVHACILVTKRYKNNILELHEEEQKLKIIGLKTQSK